ncbi:MAG TPA: DUF6265 family protein [Longimicrobiales bacterium]|nr:DUF6265 family protein [Longimicrobiales bacterium]
MRAVVVLFCILVGASAPTSTAGQERAPRSLDPLEPLEPLAFMQGCWRGPLGSGEGDFVEERHGPPAGGLMLGTVKYVRAGRPTQHEFLEIRATAGGQVSLLPYPGGRRSEHAFLLTSGDGAHAVFEAPEHDFPKRIVYRAVGPDGLEGSADAGAGDPSPRRWAMRRIPCEPRGAGA